MLERVLIVEPQPAEERILRVDAVSQDDVAQFVRQYGRETGFVRQHINQPAAQHDAVPERERLERRGHQDRKSTRLNSSHGYISYAVFCLKKKKEKQQVVEHQKKVRQRYS